MLEVLVIPVEEQISSHVDAFIFQSRYNFPLLIKVDSTLHTCPMKCIAKTPSDNMPELFGYQWNMFTKY